MSIMSRRSQHGDTIVEVMFSIAVFAFIGASTLAIMNQGLATTERTLEITQVRQGMNDQAELLRYLQQSVLSGTSAPGSPNATAWQQISTGSLVSTTASTYGQLNAGQCVTSIPGNKAFVLFPSGGNLVVEGTQNTVLYNSAITSAYPQIQTSGGAFADTDGLWVEAVRPAGANFIDFHIRACWGAPGSNIPVMMGTIVRLVG